MWCIENYSVCSTSVVSHAVERMWAARMTIYVASCVMKIVVTAGYQFRGSFLTVNTVHACHAPWILKHIFVRKGAVRFCPVNINVPIYVLPCVEIAKLR
jgi:hypothetical protein